MRAKLMIGVGVAAAVAVALVAASVIAGPDIASPMNVRVIEHAKTDTVIDTGAAGDTSGDLLTFHNPVFNGTNTNQVGSDQGDCIRISPNRGTWECRWVTQLDGGSLTVEGRFSDTHDTVLAVTGGTGIYRNARGSMALRARAGGTEYAFVFHLIP